MSTTISILTGPPNAVSLPERKPPTLTAFSPGTLGPSFTLQITNIADLVILQSEHRLITPTSVVVTDLFGTMVLVDIRINPQTFDVTFHSSKPMTGFIYIS